MSLSTFEGGRPRAIARSVTGSANALTEVVLPAWARSAVVAFVGNAGKLAHAGSDGGALGAGAYQDVPAGAPLRVPVTEGRDASQRARVFVTSATAGTPFAVIAEASDAAPAGQVAAPEYGARGLGRLADATLHNPNAVVSSVTSVDVANGYRIRGLAPAASRDLPGTGATWSWPGIPDLIGRMLASVEAQRARLAVRFLEMAVPATAPNLMRVAAGFSNSADPTTASSGLLIGLDYAASDQRRTVLLRCTGVGTWVASPAGTGQNDCFGSDLSYVIGTTGLIDELNAYPLDELFDLNVVGTNRVQVTAGQTVSAWTHRHLFFGWLSASGTPNDEIVVDVDLYNHNLPRRVR